MSPAETLSLAEWLHDAAGALDAAGYPSARADAERLAAHALNLRWGDLWVRLRDPIERDARTRADELVERRVVGEPMGYILGSVVFWRRELLCGPGVLVPRPETEVLVEVALGLIDGVASPVVVDVGTGTGAVAIAIAGERPDAHVWATEKFSEAMRYAEMNVMRSGCSVRLAQGDLFDALPARLRGACDLIVSNPPYVSTSASIGRDVRTEPSQAVFAGPTGDEVLRRILAQSSSWLAPGGCIAFEIGTASQAAAMQAALRGSGRTGLTLDSTGRPRVVWART